MAVVRIFMDGIPLRCEAAQLNSLRILVAQKDYTARRIIAALFISATKIPLDLRSIPTENRAEKGDGNDSSSAKPAEQRIFSGNTATRGLSYLPCGDLLAPGKDSAHDHDACHKCNKQSQD